MIITRQYSIKNTIGFPRILIDHGASVNHCGCDGVDALFLAIQNGHLEVAEHLLKSGALPDNLASPSTPSTPNSPSQTPGQTPVNSPVHTPADTPLDDLVANPLRYAPSSQNCCRRTSPASTPSSPLTPGGSARLNPAVAFPPSAGAAVFTPLYSAAQRGDLHAVQLLLYHGASVDAATSCGNGYAPLHTAAANGHRRVVEVLLRGGANIKAPRPSKGGAVVADAVALAVSNGHDDLALILRRHRTADAKLTEVDRKGWMKYIKNAFAK